MDDFAKLPTEERRVYFEQTAARQGISAQIIEKDFWVCWSLKRLFSLAEFGPHLTFKGGTSLSKVYKVIERFSEDVDVAIERSFLEFGDGTDPERAPSGKERNRRVDALKAACQTAVTESLMPQLHEAVAGKLGETQNWSLEADPADGDGQTLLFRFPPAIPSGLSPYFAPSVKIELGARSDHFPVEHAAVSPYVCDAIPDAMSAPSVQVRVLGAERTFWEKATILHRLYHFPATKRMDPRMSRHYYDVFRMSQTPILQRALDNLELLERVADVR